MKFSLLLILLSGIISFAHADDYWCHVDVLDSNGEKIDRKVGIANFWPSACRRALNKCERNVDKIREKDPSQNPYCKRHYRFKQGKKRVTRTCTVRKFDVAADGTLLPLESTPRTFIYQIKAKRGTNAQERACAEALDDCQETLEDGQVCQILS